MAKRQPGGGKRKGGQRKKGRNRNWCESYRQRGQRELNKARKAARHQRRIAKKAD